MSYNASYTPDDVSKVAIDGVVKIVIAVAGLATLIGLVVIGAWFVQKAKKK